ncbi:MAG: hypothetical protein FWG20_06810, partial [Candidatus Cloacimonetes bacterium]|nr:hypothetical protein [Candidatus Cloacimonadota bacterium]
IYSSEYDQVNGFAEICAIIELNCSGLVNISDSELSNDLNIFAEKSDITGLIEEALAVLQKIKKPPIHIFQWFYTLAFLQFRSELYHLAKDNLKYATKLKKGQVHKIKLELAQASILGVSGLIDKAQQLFIKIGNYDLSFDIEVVYIDRYGSFLILTGKEDEAINWYENSIRKLLNSELSMDSYGFCSICNSLGVLYSKKKMYPEAEKYFSICIKESQKINFNRILGIVYNNIGELTLKQGDTKTAYEYFHEAEKISISVNNISNLAMTYKNYGEINIKIGNFLKAEEYLIQAKNMLQKMQNSKGINLFYTKDYTPVVNEKDPVEVHNARIQVINHNLALTKNKILNFYHYYDFIKKEYPEVFEKKALSVNPLLKSYIFYLFEIGDREQLETILYSNLDYSKTKDEDFYYQTLAFIAILKKDYRTAIVNIKTALEYAHKSASEYSVTIINIYLAKYYCLNNEIELAAKCIENAETYIEKNNYIYWDIFKNIVRFRINLLQPEIPLREILKKAFQILPIVVQNKYFLYEIEIYNIITHIYLELKATRLAQTFHDKYAEKIRFAIRNLPEVTQKLYLNNKKINSKNIHDFSLYNIANRKSIKTQEWSNEILQLLRLQDADRVKFFLDLKIKEYFAPSAYAIILFDSADFSLQSLNPARYNVYVQHNFDFNILNQKSLKTNIVKAIETNSLINTKVNNSHTIISPFILKHSKIGFWVLQDSGEMAFQKSEIKMINDFNLHLSIMLIRLVEFDEVNHKIILMKDLMDITNNMMQTYSIERLEHAFIHNLINVVNAKRGFLIKKDRAGNYYFAVALDYENNLLKNPTDFSQSTVSEVQKNKLPIFIENTLYEPISKYSLLMTESNITSIYCAPILINKDIYGVIYLDNLGQLESTIKINHEMMEIFLTHVSLAINNAKTYQDLMAKNWELHTIDTMKNDFITIVSHELNT